MACRPLYLVSNMIEEGGAGAKDIAGARTRRRHEDRERDIRAAIYVSWWLIKI